MSQTNLEKIRHSLAHLMASVVQNLYPEVKFGIGPVIDNGFYYDFDFGQAKIKEEDLVKIEKAMKTLLKKSQKIEKSELTIDQALAKEKAAGQIYKEALLNDLKEAGQKKVSYYRIGQFDDLCRGEHLAQVDKSLISLFKIDKLAGAYWRGDEKNKMLTRIYGLAFESKQELATYLEIRQEAEKRDHRKIGKELDLFHIDEKVGLGLPLWHPKGAILWRIIEDFWYKRHLAEGYQLVRSPHIGNRLLWETSGHWGFFNSSMYPPLEASQSLAENQKKQKAKESEEYLLKPMNCPFHIQVYKNSPKSYRDLPLRWAECGTVYRFEKKGELSGLTRVRGFTQDDAHIICQPEQVEQELKRVVDFILSIFKSFGFNLDLINVYLSLRDPKNKEKYAGDDKGWQLTQTVLRKVAQEKKLNFKEEEGEAAFYGPKLDFKLKDVLGREWQCSTLQFDFNLPERFDLTFVNRQGEKERPYVLHRALFGSFERFIALLIEHYGGAFPVWLAPVQVKLISVGESHVPYCHQLAQELKDNYIRLEVDDSNETVGNKIRKAVAEKIPYLLVIGNQEIESNILTIRDRGCQETRQVEKNKFIEELKAKATS